MAVDPLVWHGVRKLGEGGFGQVKLALWSQGRGVVALEPALSKVEQCIEPRAEADQDGQQQHQEDEEDNEEDEEKDEGRRRNVRRGGKEVK